MQIQQGKARVGVEPETVLLWGYSVSHSTTMSPQNHGDEEMPITISQRDDTKSGCFQSLRYLDNLVHAPIIPGPFHGDNRLNRVF